MFYNNSNLFTNYIFVHLLDNKVFTLEFLRQLLFRVMNCRIYKLDYLLYVTDLVSHFNNFFCYISSLLFAFLLLLYVLFSP